MLLLSLLLMRTSSARFSMPLMLLRLLLLLCMLPPFILSSELAPQSVTSNGCKCARLSCLLHLSHVRSALLRAIHLNERSSGRAGRRSGHTTRVASGAETQHGWPSRPRQPPTAGSHPRRRDSRCLEPKWLRNVTLHCITLHYITVHAYRSIPFRSVPRHHIT